MSKRGLQPHHHTHTHPFGNMIWLTLSNTMWCEYTHTCKKAHTDTQTKRWRHCFKRQHIKWTLYTAWNFHGRCWHVIEEENCSCVCVCVPVFMNTVIFLHLHTWLLYTLCTHSLCVCVCVWKTGTALCSWCFINTSVTTEMKYLLSAKRGRAAEIAIFTAGAAASIFVF